MPIMSVFILILNLCVRSATESQVIILDLILSFISIHRGLLVHNLFQLYIYIYIYIYLNVYILLYYYLSSFSRGYFYFYLSSFLGGYFYFYLVTFLEYLLQHC